MATKKTLQFTEGNQSFQLFPGEITPTESSTDKPASIQASPFMVTLPIVRKRKSRNPYTVPIEISI